MTCKVVGCESKRHAHGMCGKHYMAWKRHGDPNVRVYGRPMVERILEQYKEVGDCWIWTGTVNSGGYGVTSIGRKTLLAHRVAYELFHGDLDPDHLVCHRCDDPLCINPVHLFAGTVNDNINDKLAKKRQPMGEEVYGAKLNAERVWFIRNSKMSSTELMKMFGVDRTAINTIRRWETWKHVTDEYMDQRDSM